MRFVISVGTKRYNTRESPVKLGYDRDLVFLVSLGLSYVLFS